jgi:tetratricopeptide (TPR) repeat protein
MESDILISNNELEAQLRLALPAELHGAIPALARALVGALDSSLGPEAVERSLADADVAKALHALVGKQLRTDTALINFGTNNEMGQISIGDVAGGNIVKINAPLVSTQVAGDLVVGTKITIFGLPWQALVALLALLLIGSGTLAWNLRGPAVMEAGRFRVAVADFGLQDGASVQDDGPAAGYSKQVFETLAQQAAPYQTGTDLADRTLIWHDSMSWRQKWATIGVISGDDEAAHRHAAEAKAEALHADVLIYGAQQPDGRLQLNFYVSPRLKIYGDAQVINGHYQFGEPAAPENLNTRAAALFWMLRTVQFYARGNMETTLQVLDQAQRGLPNWAAQKAGKEFLYTLRGLALIADAPSVSDQESFEQRLKDAEGAFNAAIKSNEAYPRAYVGRGSVHFWRAQCALGPNFLAFCSRQDPSQSVAELALAQADYQRALEVGNQSVDASWAALVVPQAMGNVYLLAGQQAEVIGDTAAAAQRYAQSAQQLEILLKPLTKANEQRLLGQAYQTLGVVYSFRSRVATVSIQQQDFRNQARYWFDQCVQQGELLNDTWLIDVVGEFCRNNLKALATSSRSDQ